MYIYLYTHTYLSLCAAIWRRSILLFICGRVPTKTIPTKIRGLKLSRKFPYAHEKFTP